LGRLFAALGIDPPPGPVAELDLAAVDRDIRHALAQYKANPEEAAPPADKAAANDAGANEPNPSPAATGASRWLAEAVSRIARPSASAQASATMDVAPTAE
jgi:hypothetical protein